eukprot:Colp12_sorted_trinity150504_noHs@11636
MIEPVGNMENYTFGHVLQTGSTSSVFLGSHKETGKSVAIKVMRHTETNGRLFENEINIHSLLSEHGNICRLLDYSVDSERLYLVFDLMYTDLIGVTEPEVGLEEETAIHYFRQIVDAMSHAHARGVAHNDIKPDNVCICADMSTVKIIDWGLAYSVKYDNKSGQRGTVPYKSPESFYASLANMVSPNDLPFVGDVWALGVLLFILLTGSFPWSKAVMSSVEFKRYYKGDLSRGLWATFSAPVTKVLLRCLAINPAQRASLDEIKELLDTHWPPVKATKILDECSDDEFPTMCALELVERKSCHLPLTTAPQLMYPAVAS